MFDMDDHSELCKGVVERIGMDFPNLVYQRGKEDKIETKLAIKTHSEALKVVCQKLIDPDCGVLKSLKEVDAIGHRVLHGGSTYTKPIIVNQAVKDGIRHCIPFGPLHNPANLGGIEACESVFPGVENVAVFDTAFHQTMKPEAYMYAIPRTYYEKFGIRKYGFHGTSHQYVYYKSCEFLKLDPKKAKIITCHLGNGSSLAAVDGGNVVDTSMGLTPLMGLVMGTRCGDLDPAVVPFLMKQTGCTPEEMDVMMNKKSGLLGVSEYSSDMRDILGASKEGNVKAQQALNMFLHRLIHYIGGYYLMLGGVDAIVFTGGIGENSDPVRKMITERLAVLGIKLDEKANDTHGKQIVISTPDSKIKLLVMPTNEELMIAMEAQKLTTK